MRGAATRCYNGPVTERPLPPALRAALPAYRRRLEARFGARLVSLRLFGSCARGDHDDDSDADVAVVIDGLTEPERTEAVDAAYAAWRAAGAEGPLLSPLVWSVEEWDDRVTAERRIALDIRREGIAV